MRKFNLTMNKTWIVLSVALSIGLLAALGARGYLNNQMAAIEARAKGKTINIIVAKRDLAKGTKLSSDTVAVRPIPIDYAHSTAISPNEFDRMDGQTLAYNVKAGEMILWGVLEGKRAPSFSARVAAGHRAITVPVDEINSISGMLEPGDIIDLMITVNQKDKKITIPLLQSVQVMATGQRASDQPQGEEHSERRQYATITLNTTFEQAKNVIAAREVGKLTALLRNPEDKKTIGSAQGDISAFLGSQERTREANTIPVLYGGKSNQNLPPEALHLQSYSRTSNNTESSKESEILSGRNALETAKLLK